MWLWTSAQLSLSPVLPLFSDRRHYRNERTLTAFLPRPGKAPVRKAFSSLHGPGPGRPVGKPPGPAQPQRRNPGDVIFFFGYRRVYLTFTESASPQLLVSVLNEYLDARCRTSWEHGGTIDKIVGDAVVGIFNAPLDQPGSCPAGR